MPFLRFLAIFILLIEGIVAEEGLSQQTILIPMRDGLQLPTDIYLPSKDAKSLPCILVRVPGDRQGHPWKGYSSLAKAGYVVAIQDTRSASDPEAKIIPYVSDGWGVQQDGYDTVEWLAKNPLTNGMIGTAGVSAAGILELLMAPTAPPALKCQHIGFAASCVYRQVVYCGGQFMKNQVEGWLNAHSHHDSVVQTLRAQSMYGDFWERTNTTPVAHRVHVPAFIFGGWFDLFLQGTVDSFEARQNHGGEGAKGHQKLLIGPWTHYWPDSMKLGDFEIPKIGQTPPFDSSLVHWFNYYLKGEKDNGVDRIPTVTYYVMGPFDGTPSKGNVWKYANQWPIPTTTDIYYLTADKKLVKEAVGLQTDTLSYDSDPANPVPTIGGNNLFLDSGPKDQRSLENRDDVLSFTTEPLSEDLEVTGTVTAKLYLSSDCCDNDVVVRLTDVYPDGRSILISDGLLRVYSKEVEVAQEEKVSSSPGIIEVSLFPTSMVFAKGHSLRITLSGSNYPRYEKNLHAKAGEPPAVAHNKLLVGKLNLSQIALPVMP